MIEPGDTKATIRQRRKGRWIVWVPPYAPGSSRWWGVREFEDYEGARAFVRGVLKWRGRQASD